MKKITINYFVQCLIFLFILTMSSCSNSDQVVDKEAPVTPAKIQELAEKYGLEIDTTAAANARNNQASTREIYSAEELEAWFSQMRDTKEKIEEKNALSREVYEKFMKASDEERKELMKEYPEFFHISGE